MQIWILQKNLSWDLCDSCLFHGSEKLNGRNVLTDTVQKQPPEVLYKKVFLMVLQNSEENTCVRVCFLKNRLPHRWFLVNFAKFLRTLFYRTPPGNCLWKVSKCGVFSGPYFPVFGLNMENDGVNLRIQSKYRKIRTSKNSAVGNFHVVTI